MNEDADRAVAGVDLLVFSLGDARFAVEAHRVDAVIAWREPVALPRGGTGVLGVIQDRGRIVSVLSHPAGLAGRDPGRDPTRVLVCPTAHGYVGLPASRTQTVGTVEIREALRSGAVADTSEGALMFVDPETVVQALMSRGQPPGGGSVRDLGGDA